MFMVSSSLYHVLINILDIIYVSVMDIDFENVDWIPESIKKQKMVNFRNAQKFLNLFFFN